MSSAAYKMIKVSKVGKNQCVGLVELYRPKALNALCSPLISELNAALQDFQKDSSFALYDIDYILYGISHQELI